jgi:phosphatidylglycerol---prolipoprotein diacylglyceryl transferase
VKSTDPLSNRTFIQSIIDKISCIHDHEINPVIFELGPLSIRWYGLAYVISFLFSYLISIKYIIPKYNLNITYEQFNNFFYSIVLGGVIGGRIGYVIFYMFEKFIDNPLIIIEIWKGGMFFYGGLIGCVLACYYESSKRYIKFLELTDLVALNAPIGIIFVRIANIINGELGGKKLVSEEKCDSGKSFKSHPSQLYEAFTEGFLLFIILWWVLLKNKFKTIGLLSSLFLVFYSIFRIIIEHNFREIEESDKSKKIKIGVKLGILQFIVGVCMLFYIFNKTLIL